MANDPQRPGYHFLPPANWINDPNGMIRWGGRYHLFYQHNPEKADWGLSHWGHAVSEDLVRWQHLPIALTPPASGPDNAGCWSGCAVDDSGTPTLLYTGVGQATPDAPSLQTQCLATGDGDLLAWTRHPGNPVIADPPPGFDAGFRDPYVWRDGDAWLMVIGSGRRGAGGAVLLYRSRDLRRWEFLHPLLEGDAASAGRMWECPFLLPLGDRHALVVHPIPLSRPIYFVGSFRGLRFQPERQGTLDYGLNDIYAANFVRDERGRTVMMAWLREARPREACLRAGWAGCLTLPRVIDLAPDGRIAAAPRETLAGLRAGAWSARDVILDGNRRELRSDLAGDMLEIELRLRSLEGGRCGLKVRRSPGGEEETAIIYDPWGKTLTVDRSRASLDPAVARAAQVAPLAIGAGEPLELRVFVDRSVIEIFANGGTCISSRIYPTRSDSTGVEVFWPGGPAQIDVLNVWRMRSIW